MAMPSNEAQIAVEADPAHAKQRQRLVGLDIFRGLTMAVMLIVDYNGDAVPSIDHAPWNGIHLADFVMPFFLFISGISMSISIKVAPGSTAFKTLLRVWSRALRLFVVGLVVQGGFYGISTSGYPYVNIDLATIRIMGILQRIALSLAIVAAVELLVPMLPRRQAEPLLAAPKGWGLWLFYTSSPKWVVVLAFFALQLCLTYAARPPASWPGCSPQGTLLDCTGGPCVPPGAPQQLHEMGCSAVGWFDSMVLGLSHVYIQGTDGPEASPNFGFDPEGLATTWGAVLTMYFGLHVGRVFRELKEPRPVVAHWLLLALPCVAGAVALSFAVPFNKRLWSPSYNLFMVGVATLLYTALFLLCDAVSPEASATARRLAGTFRTVLAPLQWLGANCILFFVLSDCCGVLDWMVRNVTWRQPHTEKNLVYFFDHTVLGEWLGLAAHCHNFIDPPELGDPCAPVQLAHTIVELLMWMVICGILYRKGIFWKI